ncbi:GSCFA domain-containing protein [Rhodoblastus acidophilus]|uniref:GSCFA domain-containing protein n=1 Tax=Candidatus Rhodoblastus alkanivorans TaxID=2954117 RepID=A0ABS9ZAB1_9HYPH|nr:GSCFA domain-containing protein [Candidatus Rhodoblastus alkanivorans]MCI4678314.1 GSCFA domain-containing protein [Candidatus Rhodoblastus alkanivorans]MCI4683572.1 GSCFA domain-containing protein [Candidatus Rhodoblastus alkanivorans]MDI4640887.1 GSCFA domain-containing protein [Rhodoblastus acidophilus]
MRNPYASLPPSAFWASSVTAAGPAAPTDLWRPKFTLDASSATLTAGSCFAQHIGGALRAAGFNWVEAEPAPPQMPPGTQRAFGYGLFSFRTGNIYTATALRQWIEWALAGNDPRDEVWLKDGRFIDPFRPNIEPQGFESEHELFMLREVTLAAMRNALAHADLFIFTLGLTEAWRNKRSGQVYSTCPGVLGGEFDPAKHVFHNFRCAEVAVDLRAAFNRLRAFNPKLKFLLTVSPVPLSATASGRHVLVATAASKAALRAAADEVAAEAADVDYFPSYEMLATAQFGRRHYAPDLRNITPEGVQWVMQTFFAALRAERGPPPQAAFSAPNADSLEDVICDEALLAAFGRPPA